MTEKIYTLEENGTISNLEDRNKVHNDGMLHYAVQCWVMNEKGQILIQRRAATKEKSAGKWDVSFGGHCTSAHSTQSILIDNVIKEGDEELGLHIEKDNIIKLGEFRYTSQENKNKEMLGVFLIHVPNTQQFVFKDGEVSDVSWTDLATLKNNILSNSSEYANRLGAVLLLELYLK